MADHFNGAIPHAAHQSEDIPPTYKHGHECEIIDPPPWTTALRTTCPICLQVLCNPQQTACGHTFSEVCIELAQDSQKQTCPECKMTNISIFPHESLRRLLNDLQVRCTIHDKEGACDWTGELRELDHHLNLSPTAPDQLLTGCKFVNLQCEFSYIGCEAQMSRKNMVIHVKEELPHHMQLLAEKINKQDIKIQEQDRQIQEQDRQIQQQDRQLMEHSRQIEELNMKLQRKEEEIANKIQQTQQEFTLKLQSKHEEIAQLARPKQDFKSTPHLHQVNFCFTLDKFKHHKENDIEWYSEPFYTHPQGYKMCVEIYINGLDNSNYVSLYTCIMKGERDDKLSWPFHGKVTILLLNQQSNNHHHAYTISFDESIPLFYRERVLTGEKNRGWGNHRFISYSKISEESSIVQYLKDDCLKFRVSEVLLYS